MPVLGAGLESQAAAAKAARFNEESHVGNPSIGVAVIGAGMAGRAHAAGYRTASTLYETDLPEVRLVAVADQHEPFATDAAKRYGFERAETDWRAVVEAPDVDAVSIVVANHLHREIAEAALAAGKHVLCEKPMAPTVSDAGAMVHAAEGTGVVAAMGFTFRRNPAINAVRERVENGELGPVRHFEGHYWTDYGFNPDAPMSWRYEGGPGSGALADIGSHVVDLAEFLCGPVESVRGTVLTTVNETRPVPLGVAVGHASGVELSEERETVENDDIAAFNLTFEGGATGTIQVSRVAFGHANALGFGVHCRNGSAAFELDRPAQFDIADQSSPPDSIGVRQVLAGPSHPYLKGGLAMDFPSVGYGQNEGFVFQARAFLEQVAGLDRLPPCPTFSHGLHNLRVLEAVVEAADADGKAVTV